MDKPTVTVSIPAGDYCIEGKPCIFARYTRKWNAYNCAIHGQLLKGGQTPRKCQDCRNHCKKLEARNHEKNAGD